MQHPSAPRPCAAPNTPGSKALGGLHVHQACQKVLEDVWWGKGT